MGSYGHPGIAEREGIMARRGDHGGVSRMAMGRPAATGRPCRGRSPATAGRPRRDAATAPPRRSRRPMRGGLHRCVVAVGGPGPRAAPRAPRRRSRRGRACSSPRRPSPRGGRRDADAAGCGHRLWGATAPGGMTPTFGTQPRGDSRGWVLRPNPSVNSDMRCFAVEITPACNRGSSSNEPVGGDVRDYPTLPCAG
jgi:hypothetical protein